MLLAVVKVRAQRGREDAELRRREARVCAQRAQRGKRGDLVRPLVDDGQRPLGEVRRPLVGGVHDAVHRAVHRTLQDGWREEAVRVRSDEQEQEQQEERGCCDSLRR